MQDSTRGLTRAEKQNPLPCPAGHAAGDAAQDMAGFLGCKRTVPGRVSRYLWQIFERAQASSLLLGSLLWGAENSGPELVAWQIVWGL